MVEATTEYESLNNAANNMLRLAVTQVANNENLETAKANIMEAENLYKRLLKIDGLNNA